MMLRQATELSADAGYCSEQNLAEVNRHQRLHRYQPADSRTGAWCCPSPAKGIALGGDVAPKLLEEIADLLLAAFDHGRRLDAPARDNRLADAKLLAFDFDNGTCSVQSCSDDWTIAGSSKHRPRYV
jgi:hypothetical protein